MLPRRRQLGAWALALVATPGLAFALLPLRGTQLGLSTALLLLLLEVVGVAVTGGLVPALAAAVIAFGLTDWYYVAPLHSLRIAHLDDLVILTVFVAIAATVSTLADRLARRGREARRAEAEAAAFLRFATASAVPVQPLERLLDPLRSAFDLDALAVLSPDSTGTEAGWRAEATVGAPALATPVGATLSLDLADGSVLAVFGRPLSPTDEETLTAFAVHLRRAQERSRNPGVAASYRADSDPADVGGAILTSVSHDLRTPLAAIKAAATSVLSHDVDWSRDAVRSFCELIDHEADRLDRVVTNLLDLSSLQAGSLEPRSLVTSLEEVTATALVALRRDVHQVVTDFGNPPLQACADPRMLEHALVNLLDNALNWSPPAAEVLVVGRRQGRYARLAVVDHGPGIPAGRRAEVLAPFQRLGDHRGAHATGIGIGLATARGLVDAMGGRIEIANTPGGGATVTLVLATT